MKYLLDTNALSDCIRNPQGKVSQRITVVGESNTCTSIIVAAELRFGAIKSGSASLTQRIDALLFAIPVLNIESPTDLHYADIRHFLSKAGTPIGPNDLWIAAHARALGMVVVSANEREFKRVPGLLCEDWLVA
jgi:tRNA(fMet)-specific endonuclease VapC